MKKHIWLPVLATLLLLSGCGAEPAPTPPEDILVEYTDLTDRETRDALDVLMEDAGISDPRRQQFFRHVDQFNAILKPEEKTNGFIQSPLGQLKYDPYEMVERWDAAHPDFLGYNCRITAFSLFGDFIQIPESAEARTDMLLFDLNALETDDSAFPGKEQAFSALFSTVPTNESSDPAVQAQTWLQDWKDRGVTFVDDPRVRMISVVFHEIMPEGSYLFIGHTGLLFPLEDGQLWFVEKLSFQEIYQVVKFQDRAQLRDYLMGKYDVNVDQPMAPPFILENDALLDPVVRKS